MYPMSSLVLVIGILGTVTADPQQVWDVDRLIRARNPGAVFTTTERVDVTWQTLRSITYSPTLQQGAVGSASVQEASLVRRWVVMEMLGDVNISVSVLKEEQRPTTGVAGWDNPPAP